MSITLTSAQVLALQVAQQALDDLKADTPPRPYAYWVGRLQRALQDVTDAFAEDES